MDSGSSIAVIPGVSLRLKNLAASAAAVALGCLFYASLPQHQPSLHKLYGGPGHSFTGMEFMLAAAFGYVLVLAVFFLGEPVPRVSKSLRCYLVAAAYARAPRAAFRRGLAKEDRVAVLTTLLKAFFGPLMVMALMQWCVMAVTNGASILSTDLSIEGFRGLFDRYGFLFLLQVIIFIDVLIFTFGYLIELPRLNNQIRSVDPTLVGWAAALLCYPPFNQFSNAILGSQNVGFPQFEGATAHVAWNLLLLGLMAVYTWASVALGFKASNLTHRGIISHGPYRFIRHPAYACKNMAWWIAAAPAVSMAFGVSLTEGIQAVASVAGWTLLYILRAVTEEDHLRGVDGEYAAYAAKVRYRFIPGVV